MRCKKHTYLVLFTLILRSVLSLTFPSEFLQVWLRSLQRVLLHLVLGLVSLKRGLWTDSIRSVSLRDRETCPHTHGVQVQRWVWLTSALDADRKQIVWHEPVWFSFLSLKKIQFFGLFPTGKGYKHLQRIICGHQHWEQSNDSTKVSVAWQSSRVENNQAFPVNIYVFQLAAL